MKVNRKPMVAIYSLAISLFSIKTNASGFLLLDENAVGTGNYNAGGAAIAEDASTAFFNPAGLVRLVNQQIVISSIGYGATIKFKGQVLNNIKVEARNGKGLKPISLEIGHTNGGSKGIIPAFHYALPFNKNWVFGLSVTSPYGLKTDYPRASLVRYSATLSELTNVDILPAFAYQINQNFSLGAGLDIQYLSANVNQIVGLGRLSSLVGLANTDTESINTAKDWNMGWHAGLLYQFTPSTRIGLSYRKSTTFQPAGKSKLVGPLANAAAGHALETTKLKGNITLPGYAMLSGYHTINEQWSIMGTLMYTEWSQFKKVTLKNITALSQSSDLTGVSFSPALITISIPENFHDTWRLAFGADYRINKTWLVRAGVGFDENPTNNKDRNIRLPDANRFAIAGGMQIKPWNQTAIDIGYTHLFVKNTRINNTSVGGQQVTWVRGTVKTDINLLGIQLTVNIT